MTNAFRRTAERRNNMVRWPISPTETSAQLTPFRLIASLGEKLIVYLAKKLTFATPGPCRGDVVGVDSLGDPVLAPAPCDHGENL